MSIEKKDFVEALDRIARSPDGQIFYRYLQRTLFTVARPEISDGALRQLEGRRMFASELMGLMAKGIADSDRNAIALVTAPGTSTERASRGAGRRITADTRVAGWNDHPGIPEPDAGAGSSGTDAA